MSNSKKPFYISESISITTKEIHSFCSLTGDSQNLHLNLKKAKKGFFGKIIIPGILLMGKIPQTHFEMLRKKERLPRETEIILEEITAKFTKPVFPGQKIKYFWYLKSVKKHKLGLEKIWNVVLKVGKEDKAYFELCTIYLI